MPNFQWTKHDYKIAQEYNRKFKNTSDEEWIDF